MDTSARVLKCLFSILIGSFLAADSRAASNRVFMSPSGNNTSDCANPLTPCLTFAGALAQVNPGGEVIAEATGGYGPLNITQAVTVSGPTGVVMFSGLQVTVNAPGATVVLRGLTIDGNGAATDGISVVAIGTLFVENCVIAGFSNTDNPHGNGILFVSPGNLFVKDTIIRGNRFVGINVLPSSGIAKGSVDHCRLEGNQYGLISGSGAVVTVRDSEASGNLFDGFDASTGGELKIQSSLASNNGVGIASDIAGSIVRVSNTTVTDNGAGLVSTGSLLSRGNNTVEGNGTDGGFTGTYSAK